MATSTPSGEATPLLGAGTPPRVSPTQVSEDVYVLRPAKDSLGQPEDPRVILICGWMDAKLRALLSYMTKYNAIYPGATQILVLSRQAATWASKANNLKALEPAADLLKGFGLSEGTSPNTLVHVFSNGGGFQLMHLAEVLHQTPFSASESAAPSAGCLILDSVPGDASLRSSLRAFTAPIKFLPMKLLAYIPLTMAWCVLVGLTRITGKPDPIASLRQFLNQHNFLPWFTARAPRVYIYSEEDLIVPSTAIEEHIAETKQKHGFPVTAEVFPRSPHVAHARTDPDRYWSIVRNTWIEALKTKASTATPSP
ncbi:hypothetical protein EIP91_012218 [Steccherinum ochraceum]|uniref:Transmembrane protein 53 n=1 Tax=Steccherinum ochraceum TaxID=92696 RepID=A0A4R0RUX7_9APHY|nr:hypothetical protein EIP91_012218 [Steccherinum ochraceum]